MTKQAGTPPAHPIGDGKDARVEREAPPAGRTAAGTRNSPGGSVIYRMRIYETVRENLPLFHDFFRTHLLPVQLRHGARLIGRRETDGGRVVAIWEYDDRPAYERIEAAVRRDPDSRRAQERRTTLPPLITAQQETFMTRTLRFSG